MIRLLRPRLTARGGPVAPGQCNACVRNGRRRLSTTAESSKRAAPAEEEPGWPMKVYYSSVHRALVRCSLRCTDGLIVQPVRRR